MDRERRNQILLVILATLAAVGLLYSTVISRLHHEIVQEQDRLGRNNKRFEELNAELKGIFEKTDVLRKQEGQLAAWESLMPAGDVYGSLLSRLEPLAKTNGIREFSLATVTRSEAGISENLDLLRYVGLKGSLSGVGSYQQLGVFAADFENHFPFMRLSSLRINAGGSGLMTSDGENNVLGVVMHFEGCAYTNAVFPNR